jgi:hypothetical protein
MQIRWHTRHIMGLEEKISHSIPFLKKYPDEERYGAFDIINRLTNYQLTFDNNHAVSNFGADTALVSGCSLVGRAAVNLSTWTRQLLDFEVVDVSERMDLPLRSRGEGKAVCMNKYLVRQVANQYLIVLRRNFVCRNHRSCPTVIQHWCSD